ncbi:MAG TPA: sensor domain-containing protein [Candidatus Limnocylindrales bacterium]|nr:sensor domain-containing protein [Candidatus Limnocylindrales bacterium]
MIEAVVLATGLLLILAGLGSARIPGGASFARPGISRSPLQAFLLSPIHPQTWYAVGAVVLGPFVATLAFGIVVALISTGLTTLLAGIGILFIAAGIESSRVVAWIERWRVFVGEPDRPRAHPYRPFRGGVLDIVRAEFADEARWRDVLYVAVDFPLTIIEFVVVGVAWGLALVALTLPMWFEPRPTLPPLWLASLAGLLLLFVAASLSQIVIRLHRQVVAGLLCTSESRALRREVETLRQSRSAVLDVEASELSRIERDLHDGAQQRLVMLSIDLGLAAEKIDADPEDAKELVRSSQEQAREALAEIRQLVRGIAPSILLDRGLVPAIESITGRGPIRTSITSELATGQRLSAAVERTAYFVVSEALANVAKHSGAANCEVRVRIEADRLVVEVWDDGHGGATIAAGGGLAGLASRVAGVDGTFTVTSPPGGPTLVRAMIPADLGPAPATGPAPTAPPLPAQELR